MIAKKQIVQTAKQRDKQPSFENNLKSNKKHVEKTHPHPLESLGLRVLPLWQGIQKCIFPFLSTRSPYAYLTCSGSWSQSAFLMKAIRPRGEMTVRFSRSASVEAPKSLLRPSAGHRRCETDTFSYESRKHVRISVSAR